MVDLQEDVCLVYLEDKIDFLEKVFLIDCIEQVLN